MSNVSPLPAPAHLPITGPALYIAIADYQPAAGITGVDARRKKITKNDSGLVEAGAGKG